MCRGGGGGVLCMCGVSGWRCGVYVCVCVWGGGAQTCTLIHLQLISMFGGFIRLDLHNPWLEKQISNVAYDNPRSF